MHSNFYKAGLALCLLILLAGSILQMLCGISFLEHKSMSEWGLDDAYISYRYAENLVRGEGLVFNHGERVEGYSNLLYVLAVAPAFWVTDRDGVYFFSVLLNILCALGALGLFSEHLRRSLGARAALAGSLLFALCLPLWVAVASGLETSLVLLISMAIWVCVERVAVNPTRGDALTLALLTVLSLLARVDGFLIPGIAILYLLLKRRIRPATVCALAMFAAQGLYELWRLAYYGALLPTSYYVKVAGPILARLSYAGVELRNIAILEGMLPYLLILLLLVFEAIYRLYKRRRESFYPFRFEILFAPLWIAYWFYIGGDHFWDRFLVILFPLGIFALLSSYKKISNPRMAVYGLVLLAALQVGQPCLTDPRFDFGAKTFDSWIATGKFLGEKYPGRTLAVLALGKMPYFSRLYAHDMMGLADPIVAHLPVSSASFEPGHLKFDPDYTLSRRPDMIALSIFPNRDLACGLSRAKYERAGYHLEYLVDTGRPPHPGPHIVEVGSFDEAYVQSLIVAGFDYAILVKN
jgi:arabinofuranosyltransferase